MIEDVCFESFAHYASGMAAMSFGMWAVILYGVRRRNRMTMLLFLVVAYIALSFLKDVVFLLPERLFADYYFVENMVSIFDICFVPLVCAFFLETTRPGLVTNRRLALGFALFMALLPVYVLMRAQWVVDVAFVLSLLAMLVTLVAVPVNVVHYSRYLSDNYSYLKGISVRWCVGCLFGFFLLLVFYQVCFYEPTWLGELVYDAGFVVVWNIVCLFTRRHRVVAGMMTFNGDGDLADDILTPIQNQSKDTFVADSLRRCMDTERLYLNPRLSLADLAQAACTNKTYISTYINAQGKTFYDYVNDYRVAEACRLIDQRRAQGEKLSMADVARQSGFNSISTFNRYFSKLKGITPTAYSRR